MEDKPRINIRKAVPGCRGERLRMARFLKANGVKFRHQVSAALYAFNY